MKISIHLGKFKLQTKKFFEFLLYIQKYSQKENCIIN